MSNHSTGILPSEIQFHRTPTSLQFAVDNLPPRKGRQRRSKVLIEEFQAKLLKVPINKLSKWKIKAKAQDSLPYLAAQIHNLSLRKRVIVLVLSCMSELKPQTLSRLLPYLYDELAIRRAVYKNLASKKSHEDFPRWIREFWKKIFRPEDPIPTLLSILTTERPLLYQALASLEIANETPLGQTLLKAYWGSLDEGFLQAHPFSESLAFIDKSSANPIVRFAFLQWILRTYTVKLRSPADLYNGHPLREIVQLALRHWGSHHRSFWKEAGTTATNAGRWLWIQKQIKSYFKGDVQNERALWWYRWVNDVLDVGCHAPSGIIVCDLGHFFAVEEFHNTHRCLLFSSQQFRAIWQSQRYQQQPFHLPEPEVELTREVGWQVRFDRHFRNVKSLHPEKWQ